MPTKITDETVCETPQTARQSKIHANCVLTLEQQEGKTLLSIPRGDRIKINGVVEQIDSQITISVTGVKHRKRG
jgi:hypothetical protein